MPNTTSTTTELPQTNNATWAVVVVHGVGDTTPGATLGTFIPSLLQATNGGLEEIEAPQNRLLREQASKRPPKIPVPPPGPAAETLQPIADRFPMHLRRFRVTRPRPGQPNHAVFAEVFWADLAAASEARSDLVKRLFRLIFDLRHIPNVAAAYPHLHFTGLLRWMLYSASWLLIGPIAGMTLFMVYLLVARYAAVTLLHLPGLAASTNIRELGVGFLGAVGAALAAIIWTKYLKTERDETWSLLTAWFGVAGSVISIVAIGRVLVMPPWPWNTLLGQTVARRLLVNPSDLGMVTLSTHLAVLFAMIYTAFVLLAFVMALAFFIWLLSRGAAFRRHEKPAGPALDAALSTTLLQVELWVVIAAALGLLVLSQFYPDPISSEDPLFTMMVTAFTLKLIFAMIIALCAAAVWWWRKLTIRGFLHKTASASVQAPEIPRLLVNPFIMYPLIAFTLFALLSFAYAVCSGDPRFHQALQTHSRFVVRITVPVITFVGFFFRQGLGSWLHIMTDITNHFYLPRPRCPWPWKPTEPTDPKVFTRQQRIEARFRRVLEEVLQLGNVTRLTIVAHSQGTITAIDVLWLKWAARLLAGKEVYLLTMGSPFTHLYQYYFPHRYPPLFRDGQFNERDWGSSFPQTIREWRNIYRVDDFIGTHIDGDGAGQFPLNRCLVAGGHTSYWGREDVLQLILPYLPGQ